MSQITIPITPMIPTGMVAHIIIRGVIAIPILIGTPMGIPIGTPIIPIGRKFNPDIS